MLSISSAPVGESRDYENQVPIREPVEEVEISVGAQDAENISTKVSVISLCSYIQIIAYMGQCDKLCNE